MAQRGDFKLVIQGIAIFVIGMVLTVFAWYANEHITSLLPNTIMQSIYWVGLVIIWVLVVWVAPIYFVLKGTGRM